MKNLFGKIFVLFAIIGNFALFVFSILFISLNLLQNDFANIIKDVANGGLYWSAIVICLISIVYGFIVNVFSLFKLIKGRGGKFIFYNIIAFIPFLVTSGVLVLGFVHLSNPYFTEFLTLFILYSAFTFILLIGSLFDFKN